MRFVLATALFALGVLTVVALRDVGYVGIFAYSFAEPAGWQVLADLTIALGLACGALWRDARESGRNPWPWLIATAFVGSLSPLLYWLTSRGSPDAERH